MSGRQAALAVAVVGVLLAIVALLLARKKKGSGSPAPVIATRQMRRDGDAQAARRLSLELVEAITGGPLCASAEFAAPEFGSRWALGSVILSKAVPVSLWAEGADLDATELQLTALHAAYSDGPDKPTDGKVAVFGPFPNYAIRNIIVVQHAAVCEEPASVEISWQPIEDRPIEED
jgi:hypothetical protein